MHDFFLNSYSVDFEAKKIILNLFYEENENKVCFTDVLTHSFDTILQKNQILSIEEYTIDYFITQNYEMIIDMQPYCWPIYYETMPELKQTLLKNQYKYFIIYSSYGLNGWVLAKNKLIMNGKSDS